jgi:phosphohistidine swiveling domain-containing protein
VADIASTAPKIARWVRIRSDSSARAVVVETGGALSHAATVAREFGIPAVVAVIGATRLITIGQVITVDGVSGTVTRD